MLFSNVLITGCMYTRYVLVNMISLFSCICEGLHKLCRECDRVFHKAVTKRSHVRFPILSAGYTDESLREQLDDEVRSIFETKSSDVTNMDIIAPFATAHLEAIVSVIALFLCQIRRIVDDRRVCSTLDLIDFNIGIGQTS